MTWEHEGGVGADEHRGSATGRLVDGVPFAYRAGRIEFGTEPDVRDRRILHLQPVCSCGWQGDQVPCGGEIVAAGDGSEGPAGWALPQEAVAVVRSCWDEHVVAVTDAAVPPWHTVRWAEQNLALRELTARQPRSALRLLRRITGDAEAHRLAAIAAARNLGVPWSTLSAELGIDRAELQELHRRLG